MNLAVVISKPGLDGAVRLGLFAGAVPAERVAGELWSAAAIAAAAGTTVEVVAYDPRRPHVPLAVPTDPASLGELMDQLPAGDGTGRTARTRRSRSTYRPPAARGSTPPPPGRPWSGPSAAAGAALNCSATWCSCGEATSC